MKTNWSNLKVTILGFSKSGIAAAKYLAKQGASCIISERRKETIKDTENIKELLELGIATEMGGHSEQSIKKADFIITSPGIPPHAEVYNLIKKYNVPNFGEIELAYKEASQSFIAITGSNGKTTTTKLVSEILTKSGLNAPTCGNIGTPAISLINNKDIDFLVTEVSSFQLATSDSFTPEIAVFLNYSPDHIDWHGNEEAYFQAKANLFLTRQPKFSILNANDPKLLNIKDEISSELYFFGKELEKNCVYIKNNTIFLKDKNKITSEIIKLNQIKLKGEHNYENIMAAVAIAHIAGVDIETINSTIKVFSPPEHRLEYVATIKGIDYYNDSKATNCESAICALNSFKNEKLVLIAGGRDKGTDLSEFAQKIKSTSEAVILIGEAADRFEQALRKIGFNNIHREKSLESAINKASNIKTENILFSPACSSFDMYKNFEERGIAFKNYVYSNQTQNPS